MARFSPALRKVGTEVSGTTPVGSRGSPRRALSSVLLPRLNWPRTARWKRSSASRSRSSAARLLKFSNPSPESSQSFRVPSKRFPRSFAVRPFSVEFESRLRSAERPVMPSMVVARRSAGPFSKGVEKSCFSADLFFYLQQPVVFGDTFGPA